LFLRGFPLREHLFVCEISMPAKAEAIMNPYEDVTVSIDGKGLVIYFRVQGKSFFFNGHSGFFADGMPEYAEQAFEGLARPGRERKKILASLKARYGSACENLLREIELFQNGNHPGLAPETRQKHFLTPMSPRAISVYLSQGCNLACSYCFNQGGSPGDKPSFMSLDTARLTLGFIADIVKSGAHESMTVFLFGGEPLLNPKATYLLARGLQDLNHDGSGAKVRLVLSTNGTIYNQEIFDIFAECPEYSRVAVSLDASKESHDRNRAFVEKGKGSSYDCVVGNLKRLAKKEIPRSISCMVPYPYDFVGAAEALHRLPVESLEIKQLNRYILGKSVLPDVFQRDYDAWRGKYIEYSDYYVRYVNEKNSVKHLDRLNLPGRYASRLIAKNRPGVTLACRVADAALAIDAAGRLIPCDAFLGRPRFYLGDVKNGFHKTKYADFENWILSRGQNRIDHERCRTCFAKRLCGGGCYAEIFNNTGSLSALDESSCVYVRETVKINLYYISQMRNFQPEIFSRMSGKTIE